MTRPLGYPLPWCDAIDEPYWQINLWAIALRPGHREFMASRAMADIIPALDRWLTDELTAEQAMTIRTLFGGDVGIPTEQMLE